MKKLLIILCILFLTGCVKNEDFKQTCNKTVKSSTITDNTKTYVVYDAEDNIKNAVITKTYTALNENGEKLIKNIKESSISYNKKYASNNNIKITVSKDKTDTYEIKYYLNVLKLKESTLEEFNIKKNSIKFFNKMREENIECRR